MSIACGLRNESGAGNPRPDTGPSPLPLAPWQHWQKAAYSAVPWLSVFVVQGESGLASSLPARAASAGVAPYGKSCAPRRDRAGCRLAKRHGVGEIRIGRERAIGGRARHLAFGHQLDVGLAVVAAQQQGDAEADDDSRTEHEVELAEHHGFSLSSTSLAWQARSRSAHRRSAGYGALHREHEAGVGHLARRHERRLAGIKPAHEQPDEHHAQPGRQDHHLERDRHERGERIPRPAADVERPIECRHPELKPDGQRRRRACRRQTPPLASASGPGRVDARFRAAGRG